MAHAWISRNLLKTRHSSENELLRRANNYVIHTDRILLCILAGRARLRLRHIAVFREAADKNYVGFFHYHTKARCIGLKLCGLFYVWLFYWYVG